MNCDFSEPVAGKKYGQCYNIDHNSFPISDKGSKQKCIVNIFNSNKIFRE